MNNLLPNRRKIAIPRVLTTFLECIVSTHQSLVLILSDVLHQGVHQTITLASTNMNEATNAKEALKLGEKSWIDFFFFFQKELQLNIPNFNQINESDSSSPRGCNVIHKCSTPIGLMFCFQMIINIFLMA